MVEKENKENKKERDFDLEEEYKKLQEKHTELPKISEMFEDFDIYKIDETEPVYLIRAVRRAVNEKISAYLHLFELFINPSNPPYFVLTALKNLDESDNVQIKEMYKQLSKSQIEVMRLDTVYHEKKEIDFVIKEFGLWQKMKPKIMKIIDKLDEGLDKEEISKERGYFG